MSPQGADVASDGSGSDSHDPRLEVMTLMFTDLVGSTRLKQELGSVAAMRLLHEHHAIVRNLLREFPDGFEISTAGDSFFLAFRRPSEAVAFGLRLQARLRQANAKKRHPLNDRVGIHAGEVSVEADADGKLKDLHGLEVDKCARVMSLAQGSQILITRFAYENARSSLKGLPIPDVDEVLWMAHGHYEFKGVAEPVEVFEVGEPRLAPFAPPPDSEKAKQSALTGADFEEPEVVTGWRRFMAGRRVSRRLSWGGAAVTALVGVIALLLESGTQFFAGYSYDLGFLLRSREPPADAIIVRMDAESHTELEQPRYAPWDRRVHARLIDQMTEYGARAVIFDVFFERPVTDDDQDAVFIAAAQRHRRVAVAGLLHKEKLGGGTGVKEESRLPFSALADAVVWGLSYDPATVDEAARTIYLGNPLKGSLASEVTRMLGKEPPPQYRSAWLNYYGPPQQTVESVSYAHVLTNLVPAARFKDRLVFVGDWPDVGYTGAVRQDERPTPYSRFGYDRAPGVEIVATATLNLVREDWLRRLSPWTEVGVVVLMGGVAGFGMSRIRPFAALAVGTIAGIAVASGAMVLVEPARIWFPWMVVSAVEFPVAFLWCLLAWGNPRARTPVRGGRKTAVRSEPSQPPVAAQHPEGLAGKSKEASRANPPLLPP